MKHNSYLKRKNIKSVKTIKITEQLKAIENPNNVDIKSVTIEHQKLHTNNRRSQERLKRFPK